MRGHLLLGRVQKGVTFLITLTPMFALGCGSGDALSDRAQPAAGCAYRHSPISASGFFLYRPRNGAGAGRVVALTYGHARNAFLIVAGLMNMPVVLDASRHGARTKMTSHAGLMVIFAFFVSVVFGTSCAMSPEQLRFSASVCGAFVVGGITLGWLLASFPLYQEMQMQTY